MRKYMSKRQRPCDFCRSRKSACRIEGQPPCRLCMLNGRECTFVEAAQPRKKLTEPSTAGGDDASTQLDAQGVGMSAGINNASPTCSRYESHLEGSNMGGMVAVDARMTSPTTQLVSAGPMFGDMGMDFLYDPAMDGSEYQFMFRTPRSPTSHVSPIGQSLNGVSVPSMSPAGSLPNWRSPQDNFPDDVGIANAEILGFSGDMDPYLLQNYQTDEDGVFKFKQLAIHSVQQTPVPIQFLVARPSMFTHSREETGRTPIDEGELKLELEQIVSVEMGRRLIALYERFIAPQYPIFASQALPDAASSPSHLLTAIYSIAFPFYMYDEKLCIDLAYDAPPYPALSRLINRALATELHSPSLAGVQALFLMAARPSSDHLVSDASYRYSMLGLLVASAVNLGLHLDPSSWKIAPWQVAQRRRLSFLIYSLDRWLAAALGRPTHIDHANWIVTSIEPVDSLGSGLSPEQWAQSLNFSALTAIQNKTLSKLFSVRAVRNLPKEPGTYILLVKELLDDLSATSSAAGAHQNDGASPEERFTWALTKLGYHFLKLSILRASLRPFLSVNQTNVTDITLLEDTELRRWLRAKILACQEEFFGFIKDMKSEEIVGLWPPWCPTAFSSLCFSFLITIVSSDSYDEAKISIQHLHSTRRELRLKATSFPVLRLGLLRIDSIFWRGIDKVLRLEPHVRQAIRDLQNP